MTRHLASYLIFNLIFILALSSCTQVPTHISGADLEIKFAQGPVINASQDLSMFMTNTSTACIEFPDDFGIKIYYQENGYWTETGNLITYPSPQNNRLDPNGQPFDTTAIFLRPVLSNMQIDGPLTMKATIEGHLCDDPSASIEKDIRFTVVP